VKAQHFPPQYRLLPASTKRDSEVATLNSHYCRCCWKRLHPRHKSTVGELSDGWRLDQWRVGLYVERAWSIGFRMLQIVPGTGR